MNSAATAAVTLRDQGLACTKKPSPSMGEGWMGVLIVGTCGRANHWRSLLPAQVRDRIDGLGAAAEFEMGLRAGDVAGPPDFGDDLAAADRGAAADQDRLIVGIGRGPAIGMADQDQIAVAAQFVADIDHDTVLGRAHRVAGLGGDIDAIIVPVTGLGPERRDQLARIRGGLFFCVGRRWNAYRRSGFGLRFLKSASVVFSLDGKLNFKHAVILVKGEANKTNRGSFKQTRQRTATSKSAALIRRQTAT